MTCLPRRATVALFLAAGFRIIPSLLRLQGAAHHHPLRRRGRAQDLRDRRLPRGQPGTGRPATDRRSTSRPRAIKERIARGHGDFEASVVRRGRQRHLPECRRARPAATSSLTSDRASPSPSSAAREPASPPSPTCSSASSMPTRDVVLISGSRPREAVLTLAGRDRLRAAGRRPRRRAPCATTSPSACPPAAIDDDLVWEALERARLAQLPARRPRGHRHGHRRARRAAQRRPAPAPGHRARPLHAAPAARCSTRPRAPSTPRPSSSITQTLQELEGDVTTITVAHRLATIRHADQILYLKDGLVVARGTFEEVRAAAPDFARQARILGL